MTTTADEIRDDLDAIAESVIGAPYVAIRSTIKSGIWTVIGTAVSHYVATAAIVVKKNGVTVGTRGQINLIEGSNVTLTVVDNSPQIDVTVESTGGGGGVSDGDKGDITVASSGTSWTIDTNAVTNAKFRASAATSVVGRSAGTGGNVADISATSNGDVLRMAGGTLGFGAISQSSVTSLVSDLSTLSGAISTVSSDLSTLAGSLGDLAYEGDGDKGDITVSSGGSSWTIDNGVVTFAKFQNVATSTLVGRTAGGSGSVTDLSVASVRTLLSINNVENTALSTWGGSTSITTLGTIGTGVWNGTVIGDAYIASALTGKTYNGITLIGASTPQLTVTGTASIAGTHSGTSSGTNTGDQTITLTGDVTGSGTGSFATTIGANKVQDSMIRQSLATSVLGRAGDTTGDVADIQASVDGDVFRRQGGLLGFGAIPAASVTGLAAIATSGNGGDLTAASVALSKLADMTSDRLLGRDAAGSGPVEQISVTNGLEFTGSTGIGVANNGVTYARMQDVSATQRFIGRNAAGSGDPEEVTIAQALDWLTSTVGAMAMRGASGWQSLAPGSANQVLAFPNSGTQIPTWRSHVPITNVVGSDLTIPGLPGSPYFMLFSNYVEITSGTTITVENGATLEIR